MTSSAASGEDTLDRLLRQHTTDQHYIEYGGFLANHMSHALVALKRIGASSEQLDQFAEWYQQKLDDPSIVAADDKPEVTGHVSSLRGKRKLYYVIRSHYEALLRDKYGGDLEKFVAGEFPVLVSGMMAAAFHGLIQVGYGLSARKDWIVCEGLAYIHHSYMPMCFTQDSPDLSDLGKGQFEVLDVFDKVKQDVELKQFMLQQAAKDNSYYGSGFESKAFVLLSYKADTLARYVHSIKFPDFYHPDSMVSPQIEKLSKWLIDTAIIAYSLTSPPNDFFMLHGVTSAWSLSHILPLLSNHGVIASMRVFLCGLLAVYLVQKTLPLDRTQLQRDSEANELTWNELKGKALAFRNAVFEDGRREDEHVYKLVQVCYDQSQRNEDPAMERVYKLASYLVVANPLVF